MSRSDRHRAPQDGTPNVPKPNASDVPTEAQQRAWALLDEAWRIVKPLADREQTEAHPDSEILNLKLRASA